MDKKLSMGKDELGEIRESFEMSLGEAEQTDIDKLTIGDVRVMINSRLRYFQSAIEKWAKEKYGRGK